MPAPTLGLTLATAPLPRLTSHPLFMTCLVPPPLLGPCRATRVGLFPRVPRAQAILPLAKATITSCRALFPSTPCPPWPQTMRRDLGCRPEWPQTPAAQGWRGVGKDAELPKETARPGILGNSKVLVQFWQSELFLLKAEVRETFFLPLATRLTRKVADLQNEHQLWWQEGNTPYNYSKMLRIYVHATLSLCHSSSVVCDHLEGWHREGGRKEDARGKTYGNICICITDLLCYKAETNTPV